MGNKGFRWGWADGNIPSPQRRALNPGFSAGLENDAKRRFLPPKPQEGGEDIAGDLFYMLYPQAETVTNLFFDFVASASTLVYVDWGDGVVEVQDVSVTPQFTHTYAGSPAGKIVAFYTEHPENILTISQDYPGRRLLADPPDSALLTALDKLILKDVKLSAMPEPLTALTELQLSNAGLTELPDLSAFPAITDLIMNNWDLNATYKNDFSGDAGPYVFPPNVKRLDFADVPFTQEFMRAGLEELRYNNIDDGVSSDYHSVFTHTLNPSDEVIPDNQTATGIYNLWNMNSPESFTSPWKYISPIYDAPSSKITFVIGSGVGNNAVLQPTGQAGDIFNYLNNGTDGIEWPGRGYWYNHDGTPFEVMRTDSSAAHTLEFVSWNPTNLTQIKKNDWTGVQIFVTYDFIPFSEFPNLVHIESQTGVIFTDGTTPDITGTSVETMIFKAANLSQIGGATFPASLTHLDLSNNWFDELGVDTILYELTQTGTPNGYVDISNNTIPSSNGFTYKATLESNGWTVIVDEPLSTPGFPWYATADTTDEMRIAITQESVMGDYATIDWGDGLGPFIVYGNDTEQTFFQNMNMGETLMIDFSNPATVFGEFRLYPWGAVLDGPIFPYKELVNCSSIWLMNPHVDCSGDGPFDFSTLTVIQNLNLSNKPGMTGYTPGITTPNLLELDLQGCSLTSGDVDAIILDLAMSPSAANGGMVYLQNQSPPAPRTIASDGPYGQLVGDGWSIFTDF